MFKINLTENMVMVSGVSYLKVMSVEVRAIKKSITRSLEELFGFIVGFQILPSLVGYSAVESWSVNR
jgi:hypothetical protein